MPAEPPELADERRTSPIELLWDLVFVFAVTQVTTLFSRETTWAGFGRSMLILALGLLIAIGMWWTYFDRVASAAEERLRKQEDAVLAAADAYSYLHLVIVAGIIIFAVGAKSLVQGTVSAPLSDAARLALCGGVAVYLIGNVGFRLRMLGEVGYAQAATAIVLMGLYALGSGLAGWTLAGTVAVLLAVLCAVESRARGTLESA